MAVTYLPIRLFDAETFKLCIVISFPEGGKIVDTAVVDNTAYLIVEAHPAAKVIPAHFHIVPMLQKLYADGYNYIGTFKMENFMDQPLSMFTVIQITSGDFGVHSQEFIDTFGESERDRIVEAAKELLGGDTSESTPEDTNDATNDDELRKLWDFSIGDDKTDNDEDSASESESS